LVPDEDQVAPVYAGIQQKLVPAMLRILDLDRRENPGKILEELEILTRQWSMLRAELM